MSFFRTLTRINTAASGTKTAVWKQTEGGEGNCPHTWHLAQNCSFYQTIHRSWWCLANSSGNRCCWHKVNEHHGNHNGNIPERWLQGNPVFTAIKFPRNLFQKEPRGSYCTYQSVTFFRIVFDGACLLAHTGIEASGFVVRIHERGWLALSEHAWQTQLSASGFVWKHRPETTKYTEGG